MSVSDLAAEGPSADAPRHPLSVGVIGAGVFGGHHARKLAGHPGVRFVGVYDRDQAAARRLAEETGGAGFITIKALFDAVEAVVIATPAVTHETLGRAALDANCHVLMEKPLAVTRSGAEALVDLAEARGRVLQVGHQERFAASALGLGAQTPRPRRLEVRRVGQFSPRTADVGVGLDLMIHDLELALALFGGPVAVQTAKGRRTRTPHWDALTAEVWLGGGVEAWFEASRLADAAERVWVLEYDGGTTRIDFVARTVTTDGDTVAVRPDNDGAAASDPLAAATDAFVSACQTGSVTGCSGPEGLSAVMASLAVEQAAREPGGGND
ncbi:MAG: Gfo/Idh/MocA family protein [Maricaulaceae bacterium]